MQNMEWLKLATDLIGPLITVIGFVWGAFWVVQKLRVDVQELSKRIGGMELDMKEIAKVLISQAAQDERLNAFEKRITRLETRQDRVEGN